MSEEHKAIVRRFIEEVLNKKNVEAADQYVASDFVDHAAPPGMSPGLEGFKQLLNMLLNAFPDFQYTSYDLIAEGDKIVKRGTSRGTHRGEFMGIAATGKQFETSEIHIARLAGGNMVEHWESADELGMMQQLGIIPAQREAAV